MTYSSLSKLIGEQNAEKLCAMYGGELVYIPKGKQTDYEKIQNTFTELLQIGATCMNAYESIATQENLSVRRVQQIVKI